MQAQLKQFLLVLLLNAGDGAQSEMVIKTGMRGAFPSVAFTDDTLNEAIESCKKAGWISGTEDGLIGNAWALTINGKIRAKQLA